MPRHPSQLYEAALEGLLLFAILQICLRVFRLHERPGLISAIFLAATASSASSSNSSASPTRQFLGWFSMGMALSIPVWLAGGALAWHVLASRSPQPDLT